MPAVTTEAGDPPGLQHHKGKPDDVPKGRKIGHQKHDDLGALGMWYALYENATGRLRSLGTVVVEPLPPGIDAAELGETRPSGMWDETARAFVPLPTQVLVDRAEEWRARLRQEFVNNADFMAAFSALTQANRTRLQQGIDAVLTAQIRLLLGAHRFRLQGEAQEVG